MQRFKSGDAVLEVQQPDGLLKAQSRSQSPDDLSTQPPDDGQMKVQPDGRLKVKQSDVYKVYVSLSGLAGACGSPRSRD